MALEWPRSFGELLRHYRLQAALTQEELAARAAISAHAISQLERGARRVPRRDTLRLLAEALQLDPAEHAQFEAAARGQGMLPPTAPRTGSTLSPTEVARIAPTLSLAGGAVARDIPPLVGRTHDLAQVECL